MEYRIKECREERNMTQEELAKQSGVSRAVISDLETGTRTVVRTSTLVKIAQALGKKVSDIFFD